MNKKRIRYIILVIILILAAWGAEHIYNFLSVKPSENTAAAGKISAAGTAQTARETAKSNAENAQLKLPPLPLTPATMSPAQKKAAIRQAQTDAEAAAQAVGQSGAEARQAGAATQSAADKAFHRAPLTDMQ